MTTLMKPKVKKQAASFSLSPHLLERVDALSKATRRSRSELAEKFMEMGLDSFEAQVDTDALLYDSRKQEKDILLKDCEDLVKRIQRLSKK